MQPWHTPVSTKYSTPSFLKTLFIGLAVIAALAATLGYTASAYYLTKALIIYFKVQLPFPAAWVWWTSSSFAFLRYALTKGYSILKHMPDKLEQLLLAKPSMPLVATPLERSLDLMASFIGGVDSFFSGLGTLLSVTDYFGNFYCGVAIGFCTFLTSLAFNSDTMNVNVQTIAKWWQGQRSLDQGLKLVTSKKAYQPYTALGHTEHLLPPVIRKPVASLKSWFVPPKVA